MLVTDAILDNQQTTMGNCMQKCCHQLIQRFSHES